MLGENAAKEAAYRERIKLFDRAEVRTVFCGFVDILGFGDQTILDHAGAMTLYERLLGEADLIRELSSRVRMNVYSDAFVLISMDLGELLFCIQILQSQILRQGYLVRGGVGSGPHAESGVSGVGVIVSAALTRAVQIEKRVRWPCVAIDPEISLPDMWWFAKRLPTAPLLFFDGLRIVSPFYEGWFQSARVAVEAMMSRYPEHQDKYLWFLRLHEAVEKRELLVPPEVLARYP